MAIGWLALLKLVPWADVIRNAPMVAEGAKKLWSNAAKKPPSSNPPTKTGEQPPFSAETPSLASLYAQLAALEAATADLQNQMLASSQLIKTLADQNTQLIQRVEAHRIRILWLARAVVVLIIAVASLAIILFRDT